MTEKPETRIVRQILQYVREMGGFAWHVPGSARSIHQPDLDGSIPRHAQHDVVHFKIEVKTETGEPTLGQQGMLRVWATQGYATGIARSLEEFMEIIENAETSIPVGQVIKGYNAQILQGNPSDND